MKAHEAPLRSMLRRLAGDLGDDVAQETFIAAWRSAASWRQSGSYRSWLLRIAWRQFLSQQRRQRPAEPLEAAEDVGFQADPGKGLAIRQALSRLGERERMAALLCFAEGYSHAEAAQIMDLPLGSLKSIVARARRGLIECLEDDRDDG